MPRTRILYVHHREDLGGAPRSLAELIAHLDHRFEPHVYVPPGRSAELFAQAGAEVHTGPVAMFSHSWDNPYAGLRWLLIGREAARAPAHIHRLGGLMQRHRFPIVHLNEAQLLPAAAVAKRAGAKVVWHLRSSLASSGVLRRRLVARAIDHWGDTAIAIDEDVAASFPLRIPLHVVFNSAEVPIGALDRHTARVRMGLPPDADVVVGAVGHLRRIKGWEDLVRAVALLPDERVHLVFVGGGVRSASFFATLRGRLLAGLGLAEDEERAARALVVELGIANRVSFVPYADHLGAVYPAFDIVAFPNRGVGIGRPALEGAAFGEPSIVAGSPHGGGVVIPGVTGVVVPPSSPSSLADALRMLAHDQTLREKIGVAARQHAQGAFDAETNARRIADLYSALTTSG